MDVNLLLNISSGLLTALTAQQVSDASCPNPNQTTRGYRNNNPLNLVKTKAYTWDGQLIPGTDKRFTQFTSMAYGFRAAFKTLRTYIVKYNCNTLQKIISKWAPASDGNNPYSYARKVVALASRAEVNLLPTTSTTISSDDEAKLETLVYCMAYIENGYWYEGEDTAVMDGYQLYIQQAT